MIKIKNLYKIYNENKNNEFIALKNINFNINKGEIVFLKGISGSGKSTLLSIISTLQKPTSGSVIIDEEHVTKLPDLHASHFRNKKIGYVFQEFNLINSLNVYHNILIALIPQNLNFKIVNKKIVEVLKHINIINKKDEIVSNLSGGEKQRVAIARALVSNAKILLFDEPTGNLDKTNSLRFLNLLEGFKREGKTVIITTHDPIFQENNLISRTIKIEDGKIVQ